LHGGGECGAGVTIPHIQIDEIGGNCPCQASGTIYGMPFYFRARSGGWSLEVCEPGADPVCNGSFYYANGDDPSFGWIDEGEALAIIAKHIVPIRKKLWETKGAAMWTDLQK
jgi:hypothetical protein